MLPVETIALLVTGAVLAGLVMGLVGFGTGIAALGFWLFVIDPPLAVPLVGICSLATTAFTLKDYGRAIRLDRLAPFLIGALIGLPLGIMLLTALDPALFKLFVGAFLIVYTAARLFLLPGLTLSGPSRARDALVGAAGGWMGGFAAIPGPLITVWCGLQGWGKDEQRAVYQPFNQAILLIALIGYGFGGLLTRELAVLCLYCVPAALAGMTLGRLGYRRLDDAQFQRVVLLLLMASGSMLVGLNALALAAAR